MKVSDEKSSSVSCDDVFQFLGVYWDKENRPFQTEEWYTAHFAMPSRFITPEVYSLSVLQTFRLLSICAPLHNGFSTFMKLIGTDDFVFKGMYDTYRNKHIDINIQYVGEDQRLKNTMFPLSLVIRDGWRAFGNTL